MRKLRWVMDSEFWDVDVSTPATMNGVARPVPGEALPLGLTRGASLSRPRQVDFFQRFMAAPVVPSFSNGLSIQRVLSLPLCDFWVPFFLGQFNVQKFVTSLSKEASKQEADAWDWRNILKHFSNKSLYNLNLCSELFLTPEDTVLLGVETDGDAKNPRKKAVLHHKFPHHNLTLEAASPQLFVDHLGKYWDVPFAATMDFSSLATGSGTSSHFCINYCDGSPKRRELEPTSPVPPSLLPGLSAKYAVALKKKIEFWRSEAPKTKMVQPYDIFLSDPHISASALLGTVITACFGDNSLRDHTENDSLRFQVRPAKSSISADLVASASFSAQHGNFQKRFLDLTRFYAQVDIPSGAKFLSIASRLASDLYNSRVPSLDAVQAICPSARVSFQQQIAGPFSFRVDAGVSFDTKKDWYLNVDDPVFAIEHALQVLGSAKAVSWYSPKRKEFMVELRFFES